MTATISTKHPAKYSPEVLEALRRLLRQELQRRGQVAMSVLDPFAGVGRIHDLAVPPGGRYGPIFTGGVELEPEWAYCRAGTICADSLVWMAQTPSRWDAIATSPTYGNRFSDHHEARDGSRRRSYTHDLGRPLTPGNSGVLAWGAEYWEFHAEAYRLMYGVVRPGGLLLLNVSDFYRAKALVPAVAWHRGAAMGAGFDVDGRDVRVRTPRLNGHGAATTAARADAEYILRLRKPPNVVEDD